MSVLFMKCFVKSNIPSLPGFLPVNILGHAGQVSGGIVDSSSPYTPSAISFFNVGNSSRHCSMSSSEPPSMPKIIILPISLLNQLRIIIQLVL